MDKIPVMSAEATFADRLAVLIGDSSVSAFARKVGLGEGLIRRYLQGSEPGLSKAERISKATNCSLEWLATGAGLRFQSAEGVDMAALEGAMKLASQVIGAVNLTVNLGKSMKLVIASYQYLRATKRPDGSFDEAAGLDFTNYVADMCGLRPESSGLNPP